MMELFGEKVLGLMKGLKDKDFCMLNNAIAQYVYTMEEMELPYELKVIFDFAIALIEDEKELKDIKKKRSNRSMKSQEKTRAKKAETPIRGTSEDSHKEEALPMNETSTDETSSMEDPSSIKITSPMEEASTIKGSSAPQRKGKPTLEEIFENLHSKVREREGSVDSLKKDTA